MIKKQISLRIILSVLALLFALFYVGFQLARLATDTGVMQEMFIKHSEVQLEDSQYNSIAKGITKYLKGESEEVNFEGEESLSLSEKETLHLEDVRKLVDAGLGLIWYMVGIGIFFLLLFFINKIKLYKINSKTVEFAFVVGFGIFLILIAATALFVYLDFDTAFTKFHELLFDNDLWLLSPEKDLLIQLMPTSFFSGYIALFAKRHLPLILCLLMACFAFIFQKKEVKNAE
ncbi:MAG: TIGR01906 family membrane protein [Christensenellales bacterium]|jgi:integral membrane protein (TIGR01906 family)